MTLAKDERIFLLILIVNLIISLIYLLAGILSVSYTHLRAHETF